LLLGSGLIGLAKFGKRIQEAKENAYVPRCIGWNPFFYGLATALSYEALANRD